VKLVALVTVPTGAEVFVTVILPLVADAGTTAVSLFADTNVFDPATPLNFTTLPAVNPTPLMGTVVPAGPLAGEKLVMLSVTVRLAALVPVPAPL